MASPTTPLTPEREAKIKEALGADFEGFIKYQGREYLKAVNAKVKELANAMIGDSGEYADKWNELNAQLDAIYEKAEAKARKQVGIKDA